MAAPQAVTVTTGGRVVILVPHVKTQKVLGPIETPSPPAISATSKATSAHKTAITSATSTSTSIVSTKYSTQVPTTFITSHRSTTGHGAIIVTKVVTSTAPSPTPAATSISETLTSGTSTSETSTSETRVVAFTRPAETPPANVPFPVGPLLTSESASPLETGGVHTPEQQFNGLAATPGVIIGTFAAIIGVGILCILCCWFRHKRMERKMALAARAHRRQARRAAAAAANARNQINSPVWFDPRDKGSPTELKQLPSESARSGTGGGAASASTPAADNENNHVLAPAENVTRLSVLSEVEDTHRDLDRDILRTGDIHRESGGYRHDGADISYAYEDEDLEAGYIVAEAGFENIDENSIGLAITDMDPEPEERPQGIPLSVFMEDPDAFDDQIEHANWDLEKGGGSGPVAGVHSGGFYELEGTSERHHSFIHAR
ncbi:hypothetical protein Dda_1594 [Drechslerella dactyloides]|uniref:Uncharacterized protein n=1 Tax=Drechslerella dactyloides TaxID=74499 RepID=A0AAD6NM82_DREDA|nr:hypothetical protein Dda_1594 [Drechslerella dactyloides]